MTIAVGIHCENGIVIGCDSSATSSLNIYPLIERPIKKINIIQKNIIFAPAGSLGLTQRFLAIVEDAAQKDQFKKPFLDTGKYLSKKAIQDFQETGEYKGKLGALLAFPVGKEFHLCEFSVADFQPEFKEKNSIRYVAIGSGQTLAEPFLAFLQDILWKTHLPSVEDGIFVTYWALKHAIQFNAGGINGPIHIATLQKNTKGEEVVQTFAEQDLAPFHDEILVVKKLLHDYWHDKSLLKGTS